MADMKFVEKCPKCKSEVQTKSLKKSIGLGFVNIPVSQFCLNPSCDWFQDFTEAKSPEDLDRDVLNIKIPIGHSIFELKEKMPDIIKQNMMVVKGVAAVIIFSILIMLLIYFLH
ncbi:Uncharacterised protein [uncultured archaeon]|nr:Uncharacterised protein [uncultured archaeon]